jgi:hypothetical protein
LMSAVFLTSRLGFAGSTLQLVKLSEDALVHGIRPHMLRSRSEAIALMQEG